MVKVRKRDYHCQKNSMQSENYLENSSSTATAHGDREQLRKELSGVL